MSEAEKKTSSKPKTMTAARAASSAKRIAADAARIAANKETLLKVLERARGNISIACKALKPPIARETFYTYKRDDPEFAAKVDAIKEVAIDFVENKMFDAIAKLTPGYATLIIWYLKTQARHRGYVEYDVAGEDSGQVNVNVKFTKKKVDVDDGEAWERPSFDKTFIAETSVEKPAAETGTEETE